MLTWIIAILLLLFKLLVQMTLTSPTQIASMAKSTFYLAIRGAEYAEWIHDDLQRELLDWLSYLSWPIIGLLITFGAELIWLFTAPPIYFWKLCWHPDGRSILQMLQNPRFVTEKKRRSDHSGQLSRRKDAKGSQCLLTSW